MKPTTGAAGGAHPAEGIAVTTFFRKYFMEGQQLTGKAKEAQALANKEKPFLERYRRPIGLFVPALFFHIIWWSYMADQDLWHLFKERSGGGNIPRYYMSITMMFGSMVAGSTSEGGASVAFPVMTLGFDIKPKVARDFSFMIQSVGMTSAAFTIIFMKVRTEIHSLVFCTLGGVAGILFGLEEVAPRLKPAESKMYFVTIWFTFAFSLYWLNRNHGRRVFDEIPDFWEKKHGIYWKPLVLLGFGFLGGIFSAMSGSGIDICSFSVLTLMFRVSEKVATPTSVVLMGVNTCVGFLYREFYMGGVENDSWGFFAVCVPIVVIGAPLGSVIGSHFHRLVLASMVYVTDTVQLIAALYIVKPWVSSKRVSDPLHLSLSSLSILGAGAVFFKLMEISGRKLLAIQEERIATREKMQLSEMKDAKTIEMN
ncbi:hypothetical protein BSKO_06512 [Bryopsis sp. KO-2023]|nr:hypothetical protein BSKO_06512 [Bryopsis sp. KO-2023]